MFNKKHIFLMLLALIIAISAISCVSASDEASDVADNLTLDDTATNLEENVGDIAGDAGDDKQTVGSEDESTLSSDNASKEVLGSTDYSVKVYDTTIRTWQSGTVRMYISYYYTNSYDFYLNVYDGDDYQVFSQEFWDYDTTTSYVDYTFPANKFTAGTYRMEIEDYYDSSLIYSTATLTVTDDEFYAVISAPDYNAYYNSGAAYTIKVTENGTGDSLSGVELRIVFTRGSQTVTKYYTTNYNGQVSFVPPVNVGTYSVTIYSNNNHVHALIVQKTAVVKKAPVSMKAYNAKTYQGFKIKLKARVMSSGKNVKEGYVIFKIKGKTYKVAVKNGVATKSIKLGKKVKKYTYTATYSSDNYNVKKVKAKAVVKKRYATKIVVKKKYIKGFWKKQKAVTFKVRTKGGKKVKGGYLHIHDKTYGDNYYLKVKNGKAKFIFVYYGNYISTYGYSYYYHKKATTKYKITYEPTSKKYKGSSIKFKKISKFKCPLCGKKKSHSHNTGFYKIYLYVH